MYLIIYFNNLGCFKIVGVMVSDTHSVAKLKRLFIGLLRPRLYHPKIRWSVALPDLKSCLKYSSKTKNIIKIADFPSIFRYVVSEERLRKKHNLENFSLNGWQWTLKATEDIVHELPTTEKLYPVVISMEGFVWLSIDYTFLFKLKESKE